MRPLSTTPRCPLCEKPVDLLGDYFVTSGDFLPADHPLRGYADRKMHWECYEPWPQRPAFARPFIEAWIKANRANPFWTELFRDDHVYITVNPKPPIESVSLRFYETGSDVRVPVYEWEAWLADADRRKNLRKMELKCLKNCLSAIQQAIPNLESIRRQTARSAAPIRSAAVPMMRPAPAREPRWQA